jgi:hypothetical protein
MRKSDVRASRRVKRGGAIPKGNTDPSDDILPGDIDNPLIDQTGINGLPSPMKTAQVGEAPMPVDVAKIAQLERELAEARNQLLQEDGRRYQILMREMSEEEKRRILDGLTDRQERILFGLEAPEERRRRSTDRPATSGGTEVCPICGRTGLTKRGLKLHMARMHKGQRPEEAEEAA